MTDKPCCRIVQVSDTHVAGDLSKTLLGVNMRDSFDAVVNMIHQKEAGKIDFVVLSGDLSHDGSEASYLYVENAFNSLHVPVYIIPGNHDDPAMMSAVYPYKSISTNKNILVNDWQFILLNSHLHNEVKGYLDAEQFAFLESCLQKHPMHRAIVMFHHQPTPVGCKWLDNIGLTNATDFWDMVARYPKVHTVFFGHVHMEFEHTVNGIPCYSPPSTCIQFKRKQDFFGLENLPPGYRWIELYEDGTIKTGVNRLDHYVGDFQENAKGY